MPPSDQDIRNRLLVVRLPALPHILLKLMEYCRNDQVGMAELAELISKDTAIAAKILGVANSSAYSRGNQKARLDQSLMSLGTDMIRTLVISESVCQAFSGFGTTSINLCQFWRHSLTTAVLAREIARKIGYSNIDEAYLAGLMHDVGRLAFLAVAPKDYAQQFLSDDTSALCEMEERTMRMTHPEAGAWLVERWKLDQQVADSVLYHHEPIARIGIAHPLVRIVYLAHCLTDTPYDDQAVAHAAELCGMQNKELAIIQNGASQKVRESADFLGIDLGTTEESAAHRSPAPTPEIHKKLGEELHHAVRTSETERNFSRQTSEPALLKTVSKSAYLLFRIDGAILLMMDEAEQRLVIHPKGDYSQRLLGLSLPLRRDGAIADSIAQKRPTFIMHSDQPAEEDPLMRLLGAEALVCLPLIVDKQCLGVMLGKALPAEIAELRIHAGFAQAFASQVASALLSLRQKQEELRNATASAIDEFQLNSRKVAHEANNPLAVIKNYLTVLNDKLERQQPLNGELSILNDEINRVERIINQFANPQASVRHAITDVNRILGDIARLLKDSGFAPASVNIVTRLSEQSDTDCDDGVLRQILLNLLKNAIEAMPRGGEITLANLGHVNQNGRLYLELSIKDTGSGIPKGILERLFSPVSSSKGGAHQGLGLSIVQDLVSKLNGFITCRSTSAGTSFELLLPVRQADNGNAANNRRS